MPVINTPGNKSDKVPDWMYEMLSAPGAATTLKMPSAPQNILLQRKYLIDAMEEFATKNPKMKRWSQDYVNKIIEDDAPSNKIYVPKAK